MLALRMTSGAALSELSVNALKVLPRLRNAGYVTVYDDDRVSLTPKGFAVSNVVISMLLE